MIENLRFPQLGRSKRPRTTQGERVYAIGDVHGRYDLLATLIDRLWDDTQTRAKARGRIVVLGDFIDRGPQSRAVVTLLKSIDQFDGVTVLLGNHEALLLDCLMGDLDACRAWLRMGGDATLASYGVAPPAEGEDGHDFACRLGAAIGEPVIDWLRERPLTARSGDYFFCHAGVRPGVALDRQAPADLLWIRQEFLASTRAHGAIVVHGHSPGEHVEICSNRIAVDTGAYRSGLLSAVGLEGSEVWAVTSA